MKIQTVTGEISKENLGIVTPHEHIFIDLSVFYKRREIKGFDNREDVKVTIDKLGVLNRDPYALKDNLIIDNFEQQVEEINRFKNAGGTTIVDATTIGIGRDPQALKKIAVETGLNIIAGAGYYVGSAHPESLAKMTVDEIAEKIICEITTGIDNTNIRAGVIGEIGISEVFNDSERKVLKASAKAQLKTGLGILVHINPWTTNGLEATEILISEGVQPDRICVCHVDVEYNKEYLNELLKMGVYIEFDNFGKEYYVDKEARRKGYGLFISDRERIDIIRNIISDGFLENILISCDVCLKTLLRAFGGWGYDHVLLNVVPMMEEAGITKEQIDFMLRINPANFLCGRK